MKNSPFTKVSKIATEILSTPCSGAPIERMFSLAGFSSSGRRNRLNSKNLEREVFLSKNAKRYDHF